MEGRGGEGDVFDGGGVGGDGGDGEGGWDTGMSGSSVYVRLMLLRGDLVNWAEHLGHGDGLQISAREMYDWVLVFSSYLQRSKTKYRYVHPRPFQTSIHAPKGITPGVCGWWMVGNARGAVKRAASIGEDGSDEV